MDIKEIKSIPIKLTKKDGALQGAKKLIRKVFSGLDYYGRKIGK